MNLFRLNDERGGDIIEDNVKDSDEVVEGDESKKEAVNLTNCDAITTKTYEAAEIVTAESDDDDSDAWVDVCKYCSLEFLTEDEFIFHLRENHLQIMHLDYPQYYPSEDERYLEPGTSLVPLKKSRAFFDLDNHQKPHNVYPQNHPIVYPQNPHILYPRNPHIVYPQNQNSWNFFSA